jgi:hypothetical protein
VQAHQIALHHFDQNKAQKDAESSSTEKRAPRSSLREEHGTENQHGDPDEQQDL